MKSNFVKASGGVGKFIVFEGADGVGKSTQAKLFFEHLIRRKAPAVLTSFPRYKSAWGKLITKYLNGDFGKLDEVSPHLASMLYVGDRLLAKGEIEKWLAEGKTVVCDRYVFSNIAHQSVKIKSIGDRAKFIKWLEVFEFAQNKITKPDRVILLTIPNKIAQQLMSARKRDIHEKDLNYQICVAEAFSNYAKGKREWVVVSNVDGGRLKSLNEVRDEIIAQLANGN